MTDPALAEFEGPGGVTVNDIEADVCRNRLASFIRYSFPHIDPHAYAHNWHIDCIAEHLEAVTAGDIKRLTVEIPPGTMKSLIVSVMWPMWWWVRDPSLAVLSTTFREKLTIRDNVRARNLVTSEWYQGHWPHVTLKRDQNEKMKFENTRMGFREASVFESMTGTRGDLVVVDDPMSIAMSESPQRRENVTTQFREALPSRLNSQTSSVIVVVQQRTHERDVVGTIEANGLPYERLILPMEFDPGRRCRTKLGVADRRRKKGALLFPALFPRRAVENLKNALGPYAYAGQYQQLPAPREGGDFSASWFGQVDAIPEARGVRRVRRWDIAATEHRGQGDPDYTVGLLLAQVGRVYYVEDVVRIRGTHLQVEDLIQRTAAFDGRRVAIRLPQDPGAAGKAYAQTLIGMLAGYDVKAEPETGSKQVRARGIAAQAEAGNVFLVKGGQWVQPFLDELAMFPNGAHDDQVDALSGAFSYFVGGSTYDLIAAVQAASRTPQGRPGK